MAPIRRFEDILAWQAARDLKAAYSKVVLECRTFTKRHLIDQMERAADSAMSNIVEGFDSGSDPAFIRFLKIARRSATEFQSHLYAARDSKQILQDEFDGLYELAARTRNLIGGFIGYLEGCVRAKLHRDKRRRRKQKRRPPGQRTEDAGQTEDGGQRTN